MTEEADRGALLEEGVQDQDFEHVENAVLGFEGMLQVKFDE